MEEDKLHGKDLNAENISDYPNVLGNTENQDEKLVPYQAYEALKKGFIEERKKMEDRVWLDVNLNKFDEVLRENFNSSITSFSENIITYLAKLTNAVYGAFFVVDHEKKAVKALAGYACTLDTMDRVKFNIGEGLIGQVAKSKEMLSLDNVETQLDSSIGRINASFLIVCPLVFNDTVYGIIELNHLIKLKPRYLTLLERISRSTAAVLQSIVNNQNTKRLLIESLQQSEDYKSQSQELEKLNQEVERLKDELEVKESNQEALQVAEPHYGQNGSQNEGLQNNSNGAAEEIDKLKNELEASKSLVVSLQEKINLKNQVEDTKPDLENTVEQQAKEIEKLKEALNTQAPTEEASFEKLSEMQKELERRRVQILSLEEEIVAKNADIEMTQDMQKELQRRKVQILALEEELMAKASDIASSEELNQLKEQLAQSQAKVQTLESQGTPSNEEQSNKLSELEETVRLKEIELQKLSTKVRETELAMIETKNQTSEQLGALARFNQVKQELEHTQQQLQSSQDALFTKENELQQVLAKISAGDTSSEHSSEEDKQTSLETEAKNKQLEKEVERREKELNMAKETIKWKDAEIDRQDEAIIERKKEIQAFKKEFEELKAENLLNLEEIVRLGKELKRKEEETPNLDANPTQTEQTPQEISYLKEEIQQKDKAIEDLTNRLNTQLENQEDTETLKTTLSHRDQEILHLQTQIEDLSSNPELEFLKDDIRQKNQVIEELSQRLNTAILSQQENEGIQAVLEEKEKEVHALKEQLENSTSGTNPDNDFVQAELTEKTQVIEDLGNRLNKLLPLQKEYDELKATFAQKDAEIQRLKEEIDQADQAAFNPEADFLKNEIKEKDTALEILKDQIRILSNNEEARRLRSTLEKEEAKVEALQKQIEELSQSNEISTEGQAFQESEKALKQSLESLQTQVLELQTQSDNSQASLEEKEAQLADQFSELEKMRSQLRKKDDELLVSQYLLNQQQDTTELNVELENLKKALDTKENIIRLKEEELQQAKDQTDTSVSGEELKVLQAQVEEKNLEIQTLQNAIANQEPKADPQELELLKQELQAREEALTDVRAQLDMQSQTSMEAIQRLNQEINSLQDLLSLKEKTLEENQSESDKAQEAVQASQETVDALKILLEQKEQEIANLQHQLNTAAAPINNDQEVMQNLQNQLQLKEEELSQITERQLLRIEALSSLKEELKQKEEKIKQLEETIQEEGGSVNNSEELEQKIAKLIEEVGQKEEKIQQLEGALEESVAQMPSVDNTEFEQMVAQKDSENRQLAEKLGSLRDQLLAKEDQITRLKEDLKSLPDISPEEQAAFNDKLNELQTIQASLKGKEEEITQQSKLMKEYHQEVEILKNELQIKNNENHKQAEKIQQQERQILAKQEEMLQKQKELTSLFNKINTAFATIEIDMEGNILSINNKFLMLLGLKVEDIERQPYTSIIEQDYANSSEYKVLWEGLKMGVSQTVENLICIGSKQKEILMNVTYIPIIGENGKPYEIVKLVNNLVRNNPIPAPTPSVSDTTNHVDQERLKAVNNSFIIQELDLEGNISDVNKQFLTFLGYDESEVIGKHHRNFIDMNERSDDTYLDIMRGLASGNFASQIFKYVGKEGERVRLRSYFNPILDENQNPQRVMVISQFVN